MSDALTESKDNISRRDMLKASACALVGGGIVGGASAAPTRSMMGARGISMSSVPGFDWLPTLLSILDRSIVEFPHPEVITTLGNQVFFGCSNLTTGYYPNVLSLYGNVAEGVFGRCTSIEEFYFPKCTYAQRIGLGCSAKILKMPILPYSTGDMCYSMTNMTHAYFDSLTAFADITFENCPRLTYVYCPNIETCVGRTFGYLGGLKQDLTIDCSNRTTDQILAMSLSDHFGNTPKTVWNLFHFVGSNGNVEYDSANDVWVATQS